MKSNASSKRGSRAGRAALWTLLALAVIGVPVAVVTIRVTADDEKQPRPEPSVADSASLEWYSTRRQSFDLRVTASGNLEASHQVEIRCQVQGKPTIVEIVPEGVPVKKGDQLVKIADDEIRASIEEEQLSVENAHADKVSSEKSLAILQSKAESERRAAEVALDLARLELDKWRKGDLVQKRKELQLELEKAERNITRFERNYEQSVKLYEDQFISLNDLEEDELAKIEGEAALETAKLAIDVYEKYTFPKEEKQFTSDVEQAQAELLRTIAESDRELEGARIELESKTRALKIRRERLAEYERQLEATTILAPEDGMVVYASTIGGGRRGDDDVIEAGKQLYFNELIIVLPNTEEMVASIRVHEAMIPFVKVGQTVAVQIDAQPGKPVAGKVSQVAVMAEDGGWWNRDLRQYRVRVTLDGKSAVTLKPAMRCTAQIITGTVENGLVVPLQAVHVERRDRFVYVPAGGGRVKKQAVKIGKASETLVEVTEGLTEGQRVLLRAPKPGEVVAQG